MEPTLRAGQSVLVNPRAFRGLRPQPGQIVLLRHPADPNRVLVKRVRSLEGERLFVVGDNRASSTDSRDFGAVALESVLGLVVCTFGLSN
jgi:nickel-type superoxide dismutase maturation protease